MLAVIIFYLSIHERVTPMLLKMKKFANPTTFVYCHIGLHISQND